MPYDWCGRKDFTKRFWHETPPIVFLVLYSETIVYSLMRWQSKLLVDNMTKQYSSSKILLVLRKGLCQATSFSESSLRWSKKISILGLLLCERIILKYVDYPYLLFTDCLNKKSDTLKSVGNLNTHQLALFSNEWLFWFYIFYSYSSNLW